MIERNMWHVALAVRAVESLTGSGATAGAAMIVAAAANPSTAFLMAADRSKSCSGQNRTLRCRAETMRIDD